MIRAASLISLIACAALAACQPAKTPEQIAAEQAMAAAQQMAAAFGGLAAGQAGVDGAQIDPKQAAAAFGAAMGAAASTGAFNDPSMSAEDRAAAAAAMQAFAGGPANPSAQGYAAGLAKATAILPTIKDEASAKAAEAALLPVFAQMKPYADALNAMPEGDRKIAYASVAPQLAAFSMTAVSALMPLASNPKLADLLDDVMSKMPEVKD